MENEKLHPSIQEFKEFVQLHPQLIKSVRQKQTTWQELYEDWYLLGAEDPKWKKYQADQDESKATESSKEKGWKEQIPAFLKNMDGNQIQGHIQQLSQAIGAIQGVINQFQTSNQQPKNNPGQSKQPFMFNKD